MNPRSSPCPADRREMAEKYLRGELSVTEATAFEDHYLLCKRCIEALENECDFIQAIRAALARRGIRTPDKAE